MISTDQRPAQRWLHTGFLESAARYPQRTALYAEDRDWTYAEVEDRARSWAAALIDGSGRSPERVGVLGYRSAVSYIGILASLLAGATFVPLNSTFPLRRTRSMVRSADLDAILVDEGALPQISAICEGLPRVPCVISPDSDFTGGRVIGAKVLGRADLHGVRPLRDGATVPATSPAYLLFTSGSTGEPKGVPITHANVLHFLDVNSSRYGFTPDDRFTQIFSQTFDLSIFDLFIAWGCGACVCSTHPIELLAPSEFVKRRGITVWFSVPSVAALARKRSKLKPGSLSNLRWSLFCGEALPQSLAETWQAAAPQSTLENLYGPTELTIACTVYRWNPSVSPHECENGFVPIGRPYEGLRAMVVGEDCRPLPEGATGELCVAGPQTFPGYWRDKAKTEQRIIERAGPRDRPVRFYRTGDRVRLTSSGNYAYIGRTDNQVQVMGHRVELGEIEAALLRLPGVAQAAAFGWPTQSPTAQSTIAFVSGSEIDASKLAADISDDLPTYMAPKSIQVLDSLPLNNNGKVDRNRLKEIARATDREPK